MTSRRLRMTLTLTSDAEPGSGFGTATINDLVPRDRQGRPYFSGSHIKGLARDALDRIAGMRGWPEALDARLFGAAGLDGASPELEQRGQGSAGLVRFSELRLVPGRGDAAVVATTTRTAIADSGIARAGTLRTVERIAVGSCFRGSIHLGPDLVQHEVDALILALRTISAVGGLRNRGAGRCIIEVEEEATSTSGRAALRSPGDLLRSVDRALRDEVPRRAGGAPVRADQITLGRSTAFVEVTFEADDPVCCPTTPLASTNVLRTGFAIPASAVQAVVLHRLARASSAKATSCFEHPGFRAWPLLPLPPAIDDRALPIWVSLTHRIGKVAVDGQPFSGRDRMVEDYRWTDVDPRAPLKGADGVLLAVPGGRPRLWKSAEMPRQISAHVALHGDRPQLFTVEAMAPLVYRGLLAVPQDVVDELLEFFSSDPFVAFGRSKTVRGGGRIRLSPLSSLEERLAFGPHTTFIAQSPLLLPDEWEIEEASCALAKLVDASGWGPLDRRYPGHGGATGPDAIGAQAIVDVRFGWNSMGLGQRVGATNRLRAARVVVPGSVFRLVSPPASLPEALLRGVGAGRERGFGAVLPHPGIAAEVVRGSPTSMRRKTPVPIAKWVRELLSRSTESSGLSPSQISQLAELKDGKAIDAFLADQRQRSTSIWRRWEPVAETLRKCWAEVADDAARTTIVRTWRDVAVAGRSEKESAR